MSSSQPCHSARGASNLGAMSRQDELWQTLERNDLLRRRARQNGQLTVWASREVTGQGNNKNCCLNEILLVVTAQWWAAIQPKPCAVPIDIMRQQVRVDANKYHETASLWNFALRSASRSVLRSLKRSEGFATKWSWNPMIPLYPWMPGV